MEVKNKNKKIAEKVWKLEQQLKNNSITQAEMEDVVMKLILEKGLTFKDMVEIDEYIMSQKLLTK